MTVKSYRKNKLNSKYAQADNGPAKRNYSGKKKGRGGLPSLEMPVKK